MNRRDLFKTAAKAGALIVVSRLPVPATAAPTGALSIPFGRIPNRTIIGKRYRVSLEHITLPQNPSRRCVASKLPVPAVGLGTPATCSG